ncbi:DUF6221 family protein [Kitasatospora sp. NPDC093806]|uniref:DUF6221 family protein n=1 Tax=Kitasatospora sp. NPDC093806 TaxID=3155075 RepID=UPI00342B2F0F
MTDDIVSFLRARIEEDAELARHASTRAVREVAAKRRVLARHALSPAAGDPELPWEDRDDCQYDGDDWPCPDLLDLAFPYADHPAFHPAWLPAR